MKTIHLNHGDLPHLLPCVATLGFFDGVHLGHRFLIGRVVDEAQLLGLPSMVITLDRHPREVLQQDYQPELLTTLPAKLRLLEQTGVDMAVVLHFDRQMAGLSARDFMLEVLRRQLNVEKFIIGYDNKFGRNRVEGYDDYARYGREMGMEVEQNTAFEIGGIRVSSSVVRAFLKEGEVELANRCLGYAYTVEGRVVHGFKEGRKMGFPTANLDTSASSQLVPANGVYAAMATVGDGEAALPAMTNVGTRPTFGGGQRSVETHIFDFQADLYDRPMALSFMKRVRSEQRFENVTQLVEQLKNDERMISQYFQKHNL